MFQPPMFREERIDVMQSLMAAHPFATVVSTASGSLTADHVPLALHADQSEKGVLRGHLAAANPLCKSTGETIDVLAIFQGPQAYITPSWYPSKQEHGKVVPTWNYAVVHAHGTGRFIREADWLMAHLEELTLRNEAQRQAPWAVSDAPEDYTARLLRGVVGFEIDITSLSGNWKLSQNKGAADRQGVVSGLRGERTPANEAMSDLVEQAAK